MTRTRPVSHRVDTVAPLLHVEHVLKTGKLVHDIERQRTLARDNRELLKKINQIYRSHGFLHVDYSYRVHQSLNSELRMRTARLVERQNHLLLDRLLRRKPTVDSNVRSCCKLAPPFPSPVPESDPPFTIDFRECTDRWLCQLSLASEAPEVIREVFPDARESATVYRIFLDTFLVLRSRRISPDDVPLPDESATLRCVAKGCLVRQRQGQREHVLLTLRDVAAIPGGSLLGRVLPGSMAKLELLNYYGTKFGRCREPIFYDVHVCGDTVAEEW